MTQITSGVRRILSSPRIYTGFQTLMGAKAGWRGFVAEFVRPVESIKILDIGCGPGDLLDYLSDVKYWGFDISETYINFAAKKFGARGVFECKLLGMDDLLRLPKFDVVVGSGLLHHMDDATARDFFRLAFAALKVGGRLLTIDPCWEKGQHPAARFLISRDRGQNVRTQSEYGRLAAEFFSEHRTIVRHKVWIPYTHCYMECIRT